MKFLAAVLLGLVLASSLPARESGFGEYRAAQESLRYLPPNMRYYELDRRGLMPGSPAPAVSDSAGLRLVGKWGAGPSVKVTGRDSLVFLSRGSQVAVINYADTANPRVLSYIEVNGLVSRSVLVGDRLYIGSTGSEPKYIDMFDVSNPTNPQKLGQMQTRLLDIDVVDTLVYSVAKDSFRVFNFADPTNPRQIGACRDSGYSLSVCNGYAYIADRWGLYVVDVRDPTSPHHEASWGTNIISVKARGNICCATTDNQSNPGVLKFTVLDVRTPSSPTPLGSLDSCGACDVFLDGQLAFLSGYHIFNEFRIVDISDSTHPHHVGTAATQDQNFGVWEDPARDLAYVADYLGGLIVMDIANLNAPIARDTLLRAGFTYEVQVQGGYAFVAQDGLGLKVLDVSNPRSPTEVGSVDSTRDVATRAVAVRDSFAFIGWVTHPWLRAVDVTDPRNPSKAAVCDLFNPAEAMVWRDSFVYVAEIARLQIANVARPRQPVLVGSCVTSDDVTYAGLCLHDTIAYIACWPTEVINVADATQPMKVGEFRRAAANIDVKDTLAYLSGGGLYVYNVASPANPVVVDSLVGFPYAFSIAVDDTLAYLGCRDAVRLVCIADLHNMRVVASAPVPQSAWKMTYVAPHLYAACFDGGVCIFDTASPGISEVPSASLRAGDVLLATSPVRDYATVRIRNATRKEVMSSAYTVAGMRVPVAASVSVGDGWTTLRLDLRSVVSGVYLLRIRVGETAHSSMIVKL